MQNNGKPSTEAKQIRVDRELMQSWLATTPDTQSVANFVPGPGIAKLNIQFDIDRLRQALDHCLTITDYKGDTDNFAAFSLISYWTHACAI